MARNVNLLDGIVTVSRIQKLLKLKFYIRKLIVSIVWKQALLCSSSTESG
jgi:hypothetical protein